MPPPPLKSDLHARYDGGWRAAVVYFGLISLGFAQPVFEVIRIFRTEFHFGPADVFLIVFVFQYLAAAILAAVILLAPPRGLRRTLEVAVITGFCLLFLRQMQVFHFTAAAAALQPGAKAAIAAVITAVLAAAVFIFHRAVRRVLFYVGFISPVFGVFFTYTMMTHSVPLSENRLAPPASAARAAESAPAVVLAVLDELSAESLLNSGGNLDADAFPNFARLAARGIWWKNAVTNYAKSSGSFPSFLKSEIPAAADEEKNGMNLPHEGVFKMFENAGYLSGMYSDYFTCVQGGAVCKKYLSAEYPQFTARVLIKFFDVFRMSFMHGRFFPSLHERRLNFQKAHLIETLKTAEPGTFHLIHIFITHQPFFLDAGCAAVRPPRTDAFGPGDDFESVVSDLREQLRCADSVIGEVLGAVDSRRKNEPLILMLISDHGNCWTDACPGRTAPGAVKTVEPSLVSIPAALLGPGISSRVDEDDFQLIDAAPTLCEAAGLADCAGRGFDGVSRLHSPPPPRPRRFFLTPDRPPVDIPLPARPVPAPPPAAG